LQSFEYEIDRGKAKSKIAKFVIDVFDGNGNFPGIKVYDFLTEVVKASLYGYRFVEIVYESINNYIVPTRLVGRPSEWFGFDQYNIPKLRTSTNFDGIPLPDKKFLILQNEPEYDNPYGFPQLSSCFWPVIFKRGGMKFWAIFTEKYGMPWIVGRYARGSSRDEIDRIADVLEDMVQDAIAVLPDDSRVDIIESKSTTSSAELYERLLEYCNKEISKAILGQTLTTDIVNTGSYSAGKVHQDVKYDITLADKKAAEEALNILIQYIVEINFGIQPDLPTIDFFEEDDVDLNIAQRDKTLSETGIKFTKKYYTKTYKLEDDDFDIVETNTTNPTTPQQDFAENTPKEPIEQTDGITNMLAPDILQQQMEGVLKPIINMIEKGESYKNIMETLVQTFPDMDTDSIEKMLARAIFVSELWGRINNG
jgi:phage gp29-like protein